jgi:hypothetical protein
MKRADNLPGNFFASLPPARTACPEFLHGIPPETPRLAEQSSDPNTREARAHAHARGPSVFYSCGVRKCVGLRGVQYGGDVHIGMGVSSRAGISGAGSGPDHEFLS